MVAGFGEQAQMMVTFIQLIMSTTQIIIMQIILEFGLLEDFKDDFQKHTFFDTVSHL